MPNRTRADTWTHATLSRLARQHFPGRTQALEDLVRQLANRHETAWRSSSAGTFRPTPAMYALALRWSLDEAGPKCALCRGTVEVPRRPVPGGPSGLSLTLGPHLPPVHGGLNVPQNLRVYHARCLPGT